LKVRLFASTVPPALLIVTVPGVPPNTASAPLGNVWPPSQWAVVPASQVPLPPSQSAARAPVVVLIPIATTPASSRPASEVDARNARVLSLIFRETTIPPICPPFGNAPAEFIPCK
jgi:hypothetical protein